MTRSAVAAGFAALSILGIWATAGAMPNPAAATNTQPVSTPAVADWTFYDYYPKKVQCADAGKTVKPSACGTNTNAGSS
ncbi:hypothetical protein [Amycolatopsis sp. cmx-11-51]|uniref:hypothetical protein n=1 Tax=Amycolatopsis sp. cmx-11-51 TaxID=2785797 RepID=UPI0039E24107